ncbi:MAG: 3-oxoacyl-[acyl-carrier-protein] reductase [Candidatus Zixiibacteriota bacterium]
MDKKVAIVTGAARGIGRAISKRLVETGHYVVAVDLLEDQLQKTCDMLGENAEAAICNITDYERVSEIAKEVSKRLGRIDIIINNAGITRDNLMLRMKPKDWQMVIDVNLTGAFNIVKAFTRKILKSPAGRIINISSVVGVQGNAGQVNYSASKAGLLGMTKSLAHEFGKKQVCVNAIAPGFIETDMTEDLPDDAREGFLANIALNRAGKPEDIADTVEFLVSDKASYISGQVIIVDGGMVTA